MRLVGRVGRVLLQCITEVHAAKNSVASSPDFPKCFYTTVLQVMQREGLDVQVLKDAKILICYNVCYVSHGTHIHWATEPFVLYPT